MKKCKSYISIAFASILFLVPIGNVVNAQQLKQGTNEELLQQSKVSVK